MKQPVNSKYFFHKPKADKIFKENKVLTSEESVVKHHKSM